MTTPPRLKRPDPLEAADALADIARDLARMLHEGQKGASVLDTATRVQAAAEAYRKARAGGVTVPLARGVLSD